MSESSSLPARMSGLFRNMPPVMRTSLIGLGVFLVGGIAGWIGHGVLAGPDDVPTVRIYTDWRLMCPAAKDKNLSCEMTEDVVDSRSGQQVARLAVGTDDKDKSTILAITVPLGVMLEPGVGLKVGGDQVRIFQYKTCTEVGCTSVVPMDKDLEGAIVKAPNVGIAVAGNDGKAVELPFSTKGFVDARRAFLDSEATRRSWWWRLWS